MQLVISLCPPNCYGSYCYKSSSEFEQCSMRSADCAVIQKKVSVVFGVIVLKGILKHFLYDAGPTLSQH